jgi:NAD(P)-dependent dehydrogenase (short-subunit alcohol dehydrogenase family)
VGAVPCDLASLASVRRCAELVQEKWRELDVLVCNAAVIPAATSARTQDGLNEQLQVNHLSHVLLAQLLLPNLAAAAAGSSGGGGARAAAAGPRIVIVGSRQHCQVPEGWDDPLRLQPLLAPAGSSSTAAADALRQLTPMQL